MSQLRSLLLVAVVGLCSQPGIADEPEPPAAETLPKDRSPEAGIERVRSEFEDLLIDRATDFSSPTATLAKLSNLAKRHLRPDERFNQPIREVLERYAADQSAGDLAGDDDLSFAVRMFELTTLTPEASAELLFKILLSEDPAITDATRSQIRSLLSKHPDETSLLLLEALRRGEWSPHLLSLTRITGEASEAVASELLEMAKTGDVGRTPALLETLGSVIEDVQRFNQQQQTGLASGIDIKYLRYAERIIQRHDLNQDGSLTKKEFSSMLLSPEAADVNEDGTITAVEYAEWLVQRNKR